MCLDWNSPLCVCVCVHVMQHSDRGMSNQRVANFATKTSDLNSMDLIRPLSTQKFWVHCLGLCYTFKRNPEMDKKRHKNLKSATHRSTLSCLSELWLVKLFFSAMLDFYDITKKPKWTGNSVVR